MIPVAALRIRTCVRGVSTGGARITTTTETPMSLYRKRYRVKPVRLVDWDYRRAGWYFVTICTKDHYPWFGQIDAGEMSHSAIGAIAHRYLLDIPLHTNNAAIDIVQVMPDHLHAIIVIEEVPVIEPGVQALCSQSSPPDNCTSPMSAISPGAGSLSTIVRSYKSAVTRWCRRHGHHDFAWKARFHDHIIRDERALEHIRDYIRNNPANWDPTRKGRG
jgi:putative transposase